MPIDTLNQRETSCCVRISLVFTTLDDAWGVLWSPDEIESMRKQVREEILEQFDPLERYKVS